ncbi:hypothetical protein B0H34DRAFT_795299 [Crassisporium funariophilum]|nr:hypothetical protein B0H34DRAFT_795299 [Crassisporium funariophilum]
MASENHSVCANQLPTIHAFSQATSSLPATASVAEHPAPVPYSARPCNTAPAQSSTQAVPQQVIFAATSAPRSLQTDKQIGEGNTSAPDCGRKRKIDDTEVSAPPTKKPRVQNAVVSVSTTATKELAGHVLDFLIRLYPKSELPGQLVDNGGHLILIMEERDMKNTCQQLFGRNGLFVGPDYRNAIPEIWIKQDGTRQTVWWHTVNDDTKAIRDMGNMMLASGESMPLTSDAQEILEPLRLIIRFLCQYGESVDKLISQAQLLDSIALEADQVSCFPYMTPVDLWMWLNDPATLADGNSVQSAGFLHSDEEFRSVPCTSSGVLPASTLAYADPYPGQDIGYEICHDIAPNDCQSGHNENLSQAQAVNGEMEVDSALSPTPCEFADLLGEPTGSAYLELVCDNSTMNLAQAKAHPELPSTGISFSKRLDEFFIKFDQASSSASSPA